MVGQQVFTEADRTTRRFKDDAVGVGAYNCDVHMVEILPLRRNGSDWAMSEGWLTHDFPHTPFELPFSIMLPRPSEATNLLVPVAVSSSHVAFGAIRLEPTWSVLGHAAGVAATLAIADAQQHQWQQRHDHSGGGLEVKVHALNITTLQKTLRSQGQLIDANALPHDEPNQWCGNGMQQK
jgi:hypothetical protein|eukprot:SAG25_NODE_4157_length_877_cov_1.057841_1_plen_180_part_00